MTHASMDALWTKIPVLTIDGGLGTEIERRGVSINVSATVREFSCFSSCLELEQMARISLLSVRIK